VQAVAGSAALPLTVQAVAGSAALPPIALEADN
jgi:hypothetical protein